MLDCILVQILKEENPVFILKYKSKGYFSGNLYFWSIDKMLEIRYHGYRRNYR
ncbi:hypothetical protein TKV_c22570 [Thermoanaerobacter kivui]|uniref:Uncharacterized protein n=1 Tax=Thermoanaerobacter kivui TaxID=2325 RepID=A0A097AU99_THEKI|nr:hypothetical protein TKV_c22570 [Thermoanaerobacter kivui]